MVRGERFAIRAVKILLVVILVAIVASSVLGQPVLVSFVETGSMEPTLKPGDGFVAIPSPVVTEIEEGDIVVFEAENLHGGGLTTHRVVGETETGYITKGDANPVTDQDGDEPPVTEGQIVAKAWRVNGNVVVIPGLGTGVELMQHALHSVLQSLAVLFGTSLFLGTQGIATLLAASGIGVLLFGILFDEDRRKRTLERTRARTDIHDPRKIALALGLLVAFVAGGTMVAMSQTHEYGMVSASFESENPTTVPTGEASSFTYPALNGGHLPVYVRYDSASSNVAVEPQSARLARGEQQNVTVLLQAPPETGYYPQYVTEHRYFAVLPTSTIASLHSIHPWLALVTVSMAMGGTVIVTGLLALGSNPVRTRSRSRSGPGDSSW